MIYKQITALNLDSLRISKILNLDKLVNLRWASFNDNYISKVEGLDNCVKLEELSLNNNCISTLSGQSYMQLYNETVKIALWAEGNTVNQDTVEWEYSPL